MSKNYKALSYDDKAAGLARMTKLPETTVKAIGLPEAALNIYFNQASKGEKIAKYVRNGGAYIIGAAAVFAVGGLVWAGQDPEPLRRAILGMVVLGAAMKTALAGAATFGVGMFLDKRRSIRKELNEMAMDRLSELHQGAAGQRQDRGQQPGPAL